MSIWSKAIRAISKFKMKSRPWRIRHSWTWRVRKISSLSLSIGPTRSKLRYTESLRANKPKIKIGSARLSTISNLVSRKFMTSKMSQMRPPPSSEIISWSSTIGPLWVFWRKSKDWPWILASRRTNGKPHVTSWLKTSNWQSKNKIS